MSNKVDVIVYGTVCLDLLWRVPELPPPGGYVEILEERKAIGGEAANTAIALDRWGVRVALVGNPIGSDADGELLRNLFERDTPHLDLEWLRFDSGGDLQTPYCVCMATPDGERTMFGYRFADLECTPLSPDLAQRARLFTMEPNAYRSGLDASVVAAGAGCSVVAMDYAAEPVVNRLASLVLTSSEHVGRAMSVDGLSEAAAYVRNEYGPTTIVTLGANGCLVAEAGGAASDVTRVPAFIAPKVVDTTGCGDIFRAGLLYGQLMDWPLDRSVRFASAAAALNCTEMGAWAGVRSAAEIVEFMNTAPTHPVSAPSSN